MLRCVVAVLAITYMAVNIRQMNIAKASDKPIFESLKRFIDAGEINNEAYY